ncbi:hypothetical protein GCM10028833_43010 [Glycomyces tarimensis]
MVKRAISEPRVKDTVSRRPYDFTFDIALLDTCRLNDIAARRWCGTGR